MAYEDSQMRLPPSAERWWEQTTVFWFYGVIGHRELARRMATHAAIAGRFSLDLEVIWPYRYNVARSAWRQMRPCTVHLVRWANSPSDAPYYLILQRRETHARVQTQALRRNA